MEEVTLLVNGIKENFNIDEIKELKTLISEIEDIFIINKNKQD